jgi:DNA-binding IclR family transcriptional regulator
MSPATGSSGECEIISAVVGEFNEMPGMKLTRDQICRLWHLPHDEAERVVGSLVTRGFLRKDSENRYGRAVDRAT